METAWIEENTIHFWSIQLHRYDRDRQAWVAQPVKRVGEGSEFIYYSAVTAGLSVSAITGDQAPPPVKMGGCHKGRLGQASSLYPDD